MFLRTSHGSFSEGFLLVRNIVSGFVELFSGYFSYLLCSAPIREHGLIWNTTDCNSLLVDESKFNNTSNLDFLFDCFCVWRWGLWAEDVDLNTALLCGITCLLEARQVYIFFLIVQWKWENSYLINASWVLFSEWRLIKDHV